MKKSSKVKPLRVNEEISNKAPAVSVQLTEVDLDSVIKMGLQDLMFQVGSEAGDGGRGRNTRRSTLFARSEKSDGPMGDAAGICLRQRAEGQHQKAARRTKDIREDGRG